MSAAMDPVYQRLLLATERTPQDAGAEFLAMSLAKHCELPLAAVLPLISNAEFEASAPDVAARDESAAHDSLQELVAQAGDLGLPLAVRVRRGAELYAEIVAEAVERRTDLLVIRRRGRRGLLARMMMGDMVGKVVAHSPCSVMIAPRGAQVWSHRVLVALDPEHPDPALVDAALAVARECGVPVAVVAVIGHDDPVLRDRARAAVHEALQRAQALGVDGDSHCAVGHVAEQIIAVASRIGADLIVIGRRRHDLLSRVWVAGATQKVIGLAPFPVLVFVPPSTAPTAPPDHE